MVTNVTYQEIFVDILMIRVISKEKGFYKLFDWVTRIIKWQKTNVTILAKKFFLKTFPKKSGILPAYRN